MDSQNKKGASLGHELLVALEKLDLSTCYELTSLPESLGQLAALPEGAQPV